MQHDAKSNGNDSIVVYFGSGQNLWVDHVTFTGHSGYNTLGEATPDWDKFLACCYDADYCTVSDCSFGLHEYGLILGYPDDSEDSYKNKNNYPRMSIISSRFTDTLTRAPGLMRYGYFHSMNNYVYNFSMAYTVHSDCKLFTENCFYDGASTKGNVVCDWNEVTHAGAFADSGSKGVNCRRLGIEGTAQPCLWRPSANYEYTSISADQAKNYCSSYSGCQSSYENMMYLRLGTKGLPSAGFTKLPDEPPATEPEFIPNGDADCDGQILLNDAVLVLQCLGNPDLFGLEGTDPNHITEQGHRNSDVSNTGDGLTNKDSLAIQRYILKLIPQLPESAA